jgi:ferric-dicitrate binding protein FerR (iron transport regulator)
VNGPTPIDSDLLARYVAGEADASLRAAVEEWTSHAPANAAELRRMQDAWDLSGQGAAPDEVDVNAAWEHVHARIAEAEGKGRVVPLRAERPWLRWVAAAAVLVGVVFGVLRYNRPPTERYAAKAELQDLLLADRSRVVVAPGSAIEVRMGDTREVLLSGSAYFEVQRDEARPFVVSSGDVQVTVLGTAFELSASDTSSLVIVKVRSGKVRVQAGNDALDLVAGDQAVYHKERHYLERKPTTPAEVWGWRILQFEEAPLALVMDQLERIYQVRIELRNPQLERCTLTAEFDDEALPTILEVIAETFALQLDRSPDGTYLLDGEGC